MKLLALLTDGYGARGGIARYNQDLLQALAASVAVDQVLVLARNGHHAGDGLHPCIELLPVTGKRWMYTLRALRQARVLGKDDWIFCGHLYMLPLAVLLSRFSGARIWLQLHGIEAWQRHAWSHRFSLQHVAFVTAVSRYTRRRFLAWAEVEPERVRVLPNTVSEVFSPPANDHRKQHLPGACLTLLSVSRLTASERYKGQDRVLAALAELRQEQRNFVYLIAGEGDDTPRLQGLVQALGLDEHVRFIGYVPDEALPDLYRSADIFAMPSDGEGFGIVFLQALASGCTVIAGNRDGSTDPLLDGRAGILVDPEDTAALVAALHSAMEHPVDGAFAATLFDRAHFTAWLQVLVDGLGRLPRETGNR
jgi:phosphatidylinositol alpha-1,6-mannosyltransferase